MNALILLLLLLRQPDIVTTLNCQDQVCNLTIQNIGNDVAYDVRGELTANGVQLPIGRASKGILARRLNGDWTWTIGTIGVGKTENASFMLETTPAVCRGRLEIQAFDEWGLPDPTPEDNYDFFRWYCSWLPMVTK